MLDNNHQAANVQVIMLQECWSLAYKDEIITRLQNYKSLGAMIHINKHKGNVSGLQDYFTRFQASKPPECKDTGTSYKLDITSLQRYRSLSCKDTGQQVARLQIIKGLKNICQHTTRI